MVGAPPSTLTRGYRLHFTFHVGVFLWILLGFAASTWASNHIEQVEGREANGGFEIRLSGNEPPQFSTYELSAPYRIFFEFSPADCAHPGELKTPKNGFLEQAEIRVVSETSTVLLILYPRVEVEFSAETDGNRLTLFVESLEPYEPPPIAVAESSPLPESLEEEAAQVAAMRLEEERKRRLEEEKRAEEERKRLLALEQKRERERREREAMIAELAARRAKEEARQREMDLLRKERDGVATRAGDKRNRLAQESRWFWHVQRSVTEERERIEAARIERERKERERLELARLEKERQEKERKERKRLALARLERERIEKERQEALQREKEQQERKRLEKERKEKERLEALRIEKERQERERLKLARLEKERQEREREETLRREEERQQRERAKQELLEKERQEKQRLEQLRKQQQEENARLVRLDQEKEERRKQEAEAVRKTKQSTLIASRKQAREKQWQERQKQYAKQKQERLGTSSSSESPTSTEMKGPATLKPIAFKAEDHRAEITIPLEGRCKVSWTWKGHTRLSIKLEPIIVPSRLLLFPLYTQVMKTPVTAVRPDWRPKQKTLYVEIELNRRARFKIRQRPGRVEVLVLP